MPSDINIGKNVNKMSGTFFIFQRIIVQITFHYFSMKRFGLAISNIGLLTSA